MTVGDMNGGTGGDAEGDILLGIRRITGSAFNGTLTGSDADDILNGGNGDDRLFGGDANDVLRGDVGNDSLFGGNQNDTLIGGVGADFLDGGAGSDLVDYSGSAAGINLTPGNVGGGTSGDAQGDIVLNVERVLGSGFDDTIAGTSLNDTLSGGSGNDHLTGGAGADRLDGGSGSDTANYTGSSVAVNINLATGTASGGHAQGDVLVSIENLTGGSGNDTLTAMLRTMSCRARTAMTVWTAVMGSTRRTTLRPLQRSLSVSAQDAVQGARALIRCRESKTWPVVRTMTP